MSLLTITISFRLAYANVSRPNVIRSNVIRPKINFLRKNQNFVANAKELVVRNSYCNLVLTVRHDYYEVIIARRKPY